MAKKNRHKDRLSSDKVKEREYDKLAVWAHDFKFLSATRTMATLVFAAVDGAIGGGTNTTVKGWNISSIVCDVDIELVNDQTVVGTHKRTAEAPVQINSLSHVNSTFANSTSNDFSVTFDPNGSDTLNELVLWLAVAPIVNGNSVEGAQPVYAHGNESDVRVNRPPIRYTSTNYGSNHLWNIPYIEQFIRISTGALATASSSIWPDGELVTMTSFAYTIKLGPNRSYLLMVLPGIIFASGVLLFLWTKRLHS
jgi:hypothetical protein